MIAPASSFRKSNFQKAIGWLAQRGYRVRFERSVFSRSEYLAGSDSRREKEYKTAWRDSQTKAVFVARGGYGSLRLHAASWTPRCSKVFMGMSDVTVLLNHVAHRSGLITIHGPVLAGDIFLNLSVAKRRRLFSYLEQEKSRNLHAPKDFKVLQKGQARGPLFGGNLSMIQATIGTPYEIPFRGSILFLEEVNEPAYRIDRMLAHLSLAGKLHGIRGLILGDFLDLKGRPHSLSWIQKLLRRHLASKKIPVLAGLRAGHRHAEVWLPLGGICRISRHGTILNLPPLVRQRFDRFS